VPSAKAPPPTRGGPGGPPGGRAAIQTDWLPLQDQRRTAAYDYDKDIYDKGNKHLTDADGRPNVFGPNQPVGGGQRPRTAGSAMVDVNAPANQGMSSNNVANDMTPVLKSGVGWIDRMFHQGTRDEHTDRGYHARNAGVGTPDAGSVHAVLSAVDPNEELPINRRFELGTKAIHDWYMAQAQQATDPAQKAELEGKAQKSAGEMIQFGVSMSKRHGERALSAVRAGNMDAAIHELQAGHGWLPDTHNVEVAGNELHIVDGNGKVTQTTPITPEYVKNIATGMATGEYGHDYIRGRSQASGEATATNQTSGQPSGSPAAQPPAVAAGPKPAPSAAASTPPAATPPVGTPPAGSPGQVIAPVAPSSLAPVTQGGGPAPATPPVVTPPVQTAPSGGAQVTPPSKPVPEQGQPTQPVKKEAERGAYDPPVEDGKPKLFRHVTDAPDDAVQVTLPPLNNGPARTVKVTLDDAEKNLVSVFDRKRAEIMKETDALPKSELWVRNKRLEALNKQQATMTAMVKEKRTEHNKALSDAHRQEVEHLKPHPVTDSENQQWEGSFKDRERAIRKEAVDNPQGHSAQILAGSPLRYMEGDQSRAITEIARAIKVNNNSRVVDARQAYDIAVDITRHIPDTVGGKELPKEKVLNGHTGKDGAYFDVVGHDSNKNPVIHTASGHTISLPKSVFKAVIDLKNDSYEKAKEEAEQKKKDEERTKTNVGKVLNMVVPEGTKGEPSYGLGMGP
jgi:hypothetical protein